MKLGHSYHREFRSIYKFLFRYYRYNVLLAYYKSEKLESLKGFVFVLYHARHAWWLTQSNVLAAAAVEVEAEAVVIVVVYY